MPYCQTSDYSARFGADELLQLTDRDRDGISDPGVFDDAAADASSIIDSYLGANGRYALPLATVPNVLLGVACDITRYKLFAQRVSQEVLDRYNQAISWLTNVSKGLASLGIDPAPVAASDSDGALVNAARRTFDDCTLNDYTHPGRYT